MVIICECREFEICYEFNNPYTQDLSQFGIYYLLIITYFLDIFSANGNVLKTIHRSFTEKRNSKKLIKLIYYVLSFLNTIFVRSSYSASILKADKEKIGYRMPYT